MKIGLSVCSNGYSEESAAQIEKLVKVLDSFGIESVLAGHYIATLFTWLEQMGVFE